MCKVWLWYLKKCPNGRQADQQLSKIYCSSWCVHLMCLLKCLFIFTKKKERKKDVKLAQSSFTCGFSDRHDHFLYPVFSFAISNFTHGILWTVSKNLYCIQSPGISLANWQLVSFLWLPPMADGACGYTEMVWKLDLNNCCWLLDELQWVVLWRSLDLTG